MKKWSAELVGWMLFKVVLGLGWTHAMLLVTPASIAAATTPALIALFTVGTAVGAAVSMVGMILSLSRRERKALIGLSVELAGLVLFAGGPLQYLFIQLSLVGSTAEDFVNRYSLCYFAAGMMIAISIRVIQVARLFHREATNPFKEQVA